MARRRSTADGVEIGAQCRQLFRGRERLRDRALLGDGRAHRTRVGVNGGERSPTRGCEAPAERRSPPELIGDPGGSEGVQLASHRPHGAPLVGLEQSSTLAGQGHVRFHHPAVDGWDRVPSAPTLVGTLSARLAAVQTGSAGSAYDGDGSGTPETGTDGAGIEGGHSDVVHDPCNKVVRSGRRHARPSVRASEPPGPAGVARCRPP